MKELRGKHLLVLISMCGLIATSLGMMTNVAGLFFTPISEDFGVGRGSVSLSLTICNLVYAAAGLLAPRLVSPRRFKPMLLLGTVCVVGATVGLAAANHLAVIYALNAVRGFAAGLLGIVLVTMAINYWFHRNTGLVTSIAVGFSGLTGALLSPVLSAVIQSAGWRTGYLTAAVIMLAFNLPALLLPISLRPEDMGLRPLGERSVLGKAASGDKRPVRPVVFCLGLAYVVCTAALTAFPQHFPGLAASYALAAAAGSSMLSVCMVANTSGKLLFGVLSDRLGARRAIPFYGCLLVISTTLLLFTRAVPMLLLGAALLGLAYSLPTVGLVMLTRDVFGAENYPTVYPMLALGSTISNALLSSMIGFMYDASGSYSGALTLLLVMVCVAIISSVFAYRSEQK